ncbi:MAG: HD domain-containing protein [Candidatus Thermoplasmatota archaeon]|nr:HD domain-containing protein [Candidatus Thermoplasmatota archaeon]MCL5789419.1 HD domain-containing protein [Candidatus Thermoplasmatota archaeon]
MNNKKTIHDSIYGSIELEDIASRLIETKEFQRLNTIKQLGFTYLVFPGATHSRFEHSLGTHYLAREASSRLELDKMDVLDVSLAGLLHDVGHSPFSHALEEAMIRMYGKDHLDVTIEIIQGKTKDNEIRDVLGSHTEAVVEILKGRKGVLSRLISGNGDVDQIDYLARDSHYTGVALGAVDIPRILRVLSIFNGEFCVEEKGLPSVEGLMVARMLMYRTVYRHKTALIVASIANDALEALNPDFEDFVAWNDCDFLSELKTNDLKTYEAIKNRRIPKGILVKCSQEEFLGVVERFEGKIMSSQYLKSPFKKEVLNVLTNGEIRPMTDFSSIMEFLERELEGMGLLVFENENEEYIRDALRRMNITGQ